MPRPKRQAAAAVEESLTPPPVLGPNQVIARMVRAEGQNRYWCLVPGGGQGDEVLVALASRFHNSVWVRRNGYVLLESCAAEVGVVGDTRIEGEIVNVVGDERMWMKLPYWPKEFAKKVEVDSEDESNMGKMPPSDSDSGDD